MADTDFEEVSLRKRNSGVFDIAAFNDRYLKNKVFFTSTYDYAKRNISDVRNISGNEYLSELINGIAAVPKTEHFSYRNIASLDNFVSAMDARRNQRRWLYHLWTSDSNNAVKEAIDDIVKNGFVSNNVQISGQEISRASEAFLRKNIQKITRIASDLNSLSVDNPEIMVEELMVDYLGNMNQNRINGLARNDLGQLYLSAARNLSEEDFTEMYDIVNELVSRTQQWQKDNFIATGDLQKSAWQIANEARTEKYAQDIIFNPKAARLEQLRESRGLKGFLKNFLFRGTPLTIEEINRIEEKGTRFEKRQLKKALKDFFGEIDNPIEDEDNQKINVVEQLYKRYKNATGSEKQAIGKLQVGLRIDDRGRIYSTADIEKGIDKGLAFIDSIFPFSMFHHKDMAFNDANRPSIYTFNAGAREIIASRLSNSSSEYLDEALTFVDGRLYNSSGEEITTARGKYKLISSRSGLMKEYTDTVLGTRPTRDFSKEPPTFFNWLQQALDIDIHRVKETREAGSYTDVYGAFNKESKDFLNRQLEVLNKIGRDIANNYTSEDVYKAHNAVAGLDKFVGFTEKHTAGFSLDSLLKIQERIQTMATEDSSFDNTKKTLDTLLELYNIKDDTVKLDKLARSLSESQLKYPSAKEAIASYMFNPKGALARRNVVADLAKTYTEGKYNSLDFRRMLIKELSSELSISLREELTENLTGDAKLGMSCLFEFYEETLGFAAGEKAKNIAVTTYLNHLLDVGGSENYGEDYIGKRKSAIKELINITDSTNQEDVVIKEQIAKLVKYFTDGGPDLGVDVKDMVREGISPMVLIGRNKGIRINPLLLIQQVNQGHFDKAAKHVGYGVKGFFSQFASKYGDENFTEISLTAWHIMNRINSTLNGGSSAETSSFKIKDSLKIHLGLGLHNPKDLESSYAILKGLTLKRFLPVVGAFKAVEVVDDVLKSTVGMGFTEAAASGAANLYLGVKKATGLVGLDEGLKGLTQDNAIIEYFAGFTGDENPEWKTYEEQKKYYEKGYSAVRKARFWTFGSANEFRGGKISYFEPNTLRLLGSDFRNESLFNGSFWTKYNPMRLIDPYYLEKLHYNDRPYPVSGSLFEDSTPYGIVLNYAIGDIIKPKILMHQDRLQGGVDVKALIAKINSDIRNKKNGNNLFVIKNGSLRAVDYTPFTNPTPETSINAGEEENIPVAENFGTIPLDTVENAPYTNPLVPISQEKSKLTTRDVITIKAAQGNNIAQGLDRALGPSSLNQIKQINQYTRQRAEYDKDAGLLQEQKLDNYANVIDNMIDNAEDIEDVMTETSKNDYIQQSLISARMLTGFYGYMATSLTGLGDNKYRRIATSADMTSNSRYFWDSGIGGFGGDVMEIGRRFIPEYRRFQTVNPLMNEMPDWLPEKYRIGDPYCVSSNTLIENNELDFIEAKDIVVGDKIYTHKGNKQAVEKIKVRSVNKDEKVYNFIISSISAAASQFSENHPILRCSKPKMRRLGRKKDEVLKTYNRANIMLNALKNNITNKKELASIANIKTDDSYIVFDLLYKNGYIEDYKKNKYNIKLLKYGQFDIDLISLDLEWTKAKDLQIGDYVAYPIPSFEEHDIIIDMAPINNYPYSEKYIYNSGNIKHKETIEIYEWMEENGCHSYNRGDLKVLLESKQWNRTTFESVQAFFRKNKTIERIPRFIKLTPELCYSLGVYLAEGYSSNTGIELAVHVTEEWMVRRCCEGFKQINPDLKYSFKLRTNSNGAYGSIPGICIYNLCNYLVGSGAKTKKIHNLFWNAKKECILRLIEGYLDGDGCYFSTYSEITFKKIEKVEATSASKILLFQIRKLLLRFGIIAGVQIHNKAKQPVKINNGYNGISGEAYSLVIRGVQARKAADLIWNIKAENTSERKASHTFIQGNYIFMRIENIIECNDVEKVWGFQASEDKSFCTIGLATHNTLVPLGEARLPGRGYESLNELHSDAYGRYGAFDRFKILADIAPNSAEYKVWRKIASKTVQDPELKEEMKEIRKRVREQNKQNDFAPYKYVGRDIERKKYIVSEVLKNGQFKVVGSDETYKVAGVRIKANKEEDTTQVLTRYIKPGQEVILAIDTNEAYQRNRDKAHSINAAIIVENESLGELMIQNKDAIRRASDISSASYMARHNSIVNGINYASEFLAHLDIPVIHNRWLNVNDPLEKYKDDYVYGTSFQSWDEPVNSFIMPAMKKAATSPMFMMAGIVSDILYNSVDLEQPGSKKLSKILSSKIDWNKGTFTLGKGLIVSGKTRRALQVANMFTDRASLAGQIVAKAVHLGAPNSETLKRVDYRNTFKLFGLGYAAYNNQGDLSVQLMATSRLGYLLSDLYGGANLRRNTIGAGIGAAIGLIRWAEHQKLLAEDETASEFIPDEVRRRWDIEEYFDRLEYVKYKALFLEASRKAESEENVDIKHILYSQRREAKQAKKIRPKSSNI